MRHVGKLAVLATGAIATGATALLVGPRVAAAASRAASGGRGCSPNNPLPMPSTSGAARQIPLVAPRLRAAWAELVGGEMPPAALEIALAQAWLESGVGTWWKDKSGSGGGDMRGSNNLGARQCGLQDSGGDAWSCVEYGDSAPNADGTQTYFPAKFRYYKAGTIGGKQRSAEEAGAYDFLYSIVRQWPAADELKAGDVLGYCMKQGPKYRKGDPPDQEVFGREYKGGNGYYGGFGATMQDRVGGYGRAIISHLPAIAAALGHTKIRACIAPELLAEGKAHVAATAGVDGPPAVSVGEVTDLDRLSAKIEAERAARKAANCGKGVVCPYYMRSACYYCGANEGYARCGKRPCSRCGETWFGPEGSDADDRPKTVSGADDAAATGGDTLQALYLAGALPRARAIPGSNGSAFVWYIEPAPALEKVA